MEREKWEERDGQIDRDTKRRGEQEKEIERESDRGRLGTAKER